MCGCAAIALGALFPRAALVLIALFSNEIQRAFSGEWLLPVLGWFVLPYTTLSYVGLYWWMGEVTGISWAFVALAFLMDVGAWGGSARRR